MKINEIPAYVVPMELTTLCDIRGCLDDAVWYYRNPTADPDAFQIWSLCDAHALELDNRLEANETT